MGADTVLVAGASGYLGRRVVGELRRRGVPVRALSSARQHPDADAAVEELAGAGADVVAADATRPGSLVGVCDGCFAVVSCMAADMRWTSGSPEEVDREANIALFQEAAGTASRAIAGSINNSSRSSSGTSTAGAGRVASSSGSGSSSGGVRHFLLVATFEGRAARAQVPLHRAKEAAVDFVESLAGEYGITFTILRPTAYFRDFTDMPWRALQRSNVMLVPGGGRSRVNPIDGAELAVFVADCVLDPTSEKWANQEVRIGGPQVLTFQDTILAAAEALGKREDQLWLLPLPIFVLRAAAAAAGLLGLLWQPAAIVSGALRFVIYSCTHDAVGMRWGSRTVADHYRDLRKQLDQQRQQGQAWHGQLLAGRREE